MVGERGGEETRVNLHMENKVASSPWSHMNGPSGRGWDGNEGVRMQFIPTPPRGLLQMDSGNPQLVL